MKKVFGFLTFLILGLNFGYCDDIEDLIVKVCPDGQSDCLHTFTDYHVYNGYTSLQVIDSYVNGTTKTVCINIESSNSNDAFWFSSQGNTNINQNPYTNYVYWNSYIGHYLCFPTNQYQITIKCGNSSIIDGDIFVLDNLLASALPKMTSQQCQSEYSLISPNDVQTEIKFVESNGDNISYYLGYNKSATINLNGVDFDPYQLNGNYTFDLIPIGGGSCNTGSVSSGENWSALYINNLQFPGKSNIFVTIPDYIYWDYSSDDNDFNLYVGSGYDVEYIEKIIDINSYQPSSEDFTEIFVGGLTWIMPYIVIVLFIVFVWKLLKRIFR